jgi:formate dehydrogenase subunit gamma
MLGALVLFYIIRGKIMIEGEKTGERILRFKLIERIAHWTMAIPFVLLAITGLSLLFGRVALIPIFGKEVFTPIAIAGKFVHNYVAWPFMLGVILCFVLWVWKNLPEKTDIGWMLKAGGLFSKGVHPSEGKFNAGEKIVFWSVITFGVLISLTGLSLLFPYQLPFFAPVFGVLNDLGLPQLFGIGALDTALAPQEEMQFAQLIHAIIAFVYMAIIIAHIYLGSVGMEGALDSMTKGTVEVQWAKEHHDLWYEDVVKEGAAAKSADQPN